MKAAIIDDLKQCREEIQNCLNRYLEENYAGELPVIESFESGEAFLSSFTPESFDIIFIDQYMTGLSGIDTAHKIREKDKLAALVFITTSRDHAIDSYSVRACGYLVKPYQYEDFEKTMALAGVKKIQNARFVCIEQEKILLREILFCERAEHYSEIHTGKYGLLRFRIPFSKLAALFAPYPQFLACYKGCIVNLDRAECIDGLDFLMDSGDRVSFSRQRKKEIETLFYEYVFRREREDELF